MHKCGWGPPNCPGEHRQKWWRFPSPGPRSREREWRKQHSKQASVVPKLPPSSSFPRQTNNQRGTRTKQNLEKLFLSKSSQCCRAARSTPPTKGSPWRGAAAGSGWNSWSGSDLRRGDCGQQRASPSPPRQMGFWNAWEPGKNGRESSMSQSRVF